MGIIKRENKDKGREVICKMTNQGSNEEMVNMNLEMKKWLSKRLNGFNVGYGDRKIIILDGGDRLEKPLMYIFKDIHTEAHALIEAVLWEITKENELNGT